MSAEDWPDFWLKGKYIDWIETVNLVKTINTIGTIGTVETINTLETLNTVETIQKINPQTIDSTEYNTVLDLIKLIKQIESVSSIGTLNTVNSVGSVGSISTVDTINLLKQINTINTVNNLGTLETLNTVGTIQKINPQNTDNVVIDRVKTINMIETVDNLGTLNTINTINTINLIKALYNAQIRVVGIMNGDFETGDLTGWYTQYTGPSYGSVEVTDEQALFSNYSCKFTVASPMPSATPEIDQNIMMPVSLIERIDLYWLGETDTELWVRISYTDASYDEFYFTNPGAPFWRCASITNSQLTEGKIASRIKIGPSINSINEGKTIYVDAVTLIPRTPVYQVEKDRTITDITKVSSVHSFDVSASSSGNNAIWTPSSGKAIRLKLIQYESDADVEVGLRFGSTGSLFARRTTKGVMALNLVGCNIQGGTDEALNLYVGGAVNVKGFVLGEEI